MSPRGLTPPDRPVILLQKGRSVAEPVEKKLIVEIHKIIEEPIKYDPAEYDLARGGAK